MIEWLKEQKLRLKTIFYRRKLERDLHDEMAFHLEMREEKLRKAGVRDAGSAARRQFGSVTRVEEDCRDRWTFVTFERLLADLGYGARSLARKPSFTIVALLTLALGIGANSAVFSAIDAILLRPLPFPNGDQLMTLSQFKPTVSNSSRPLAPVRLAEWDRTNSTFQSMSGYYTEDISETSGTLPEKMTRAWTAPKFFQTWGVSPALGRVFTPEEEHFRGPNAVVITDRFWRRRFGAAPNVIGKQLRMEKVLYTIVGVMPAAFLFPSRDVDAFVASPLDAPFAQSRESTWFNTIGRLMPNVTIEQARTDLSTIQTQLGNQFPRTDADLAVSIEPLKEATVSTTSSSLWMLFGAVSVLLLIACTNIAALLLARSADREKDISIRLSLGASRRSVMTHLLAEVFLLALAGSLLGLAFAVSASGIFRSLAQNLPRVEEIRLNWTLVLYTLACAVGATFLCGLLPSLRAVRRGVAGTLAQTSRGLVSTRNGLQWLLVGVQVALSVTLLVGAGLLLRSFQELGRVSPGFDSSHVLTFRISANWAETTDLKLLRRRVDGTLESLRSTPGIEAAATSLAIPGVPFDRPEDLRVVEGGADVNQKISAYSRIVSAGYFTTLKIPVLAGETCREGDSAMAKVVVNRSFADAYLGGSPQIGQHIDSVPTRPYTGAAEILGMVGDAREQGLNHEPQPTVYYCNNAALPTPAFLVRTSSDPSGMASTIRARVHEIEPNRSVYDVVTLQDRLDETFSENRLRTILLTFFAVTAISLACLGIYGTLSYLVNVRRREVGLRIALGALRSEIALQFLTMGLRACVVGAVAGLLLAGALGKVLTEMLYGVSPLDSTTFAGVLILVLLTGILASLLPAIRAARLGPMQVLRDE